MVPSQSAATSGRAYLDVPFSEKDEAKQVGARWDQGARRWYDPCPPTPALQRWAARPDVPELLPGEDRNFGQGLFVDLVPSSCWFTNVRWCITEADWERLRRPILRRTCDRCEACGTAANRRAGQWLEVHERWHYDYDRGVQSLRRLIALCTACHTSTHLGLAAIRGHADEALAHLQAVTGMTDAEARDHVRVAYEKWAVRSALSWELDLSILTAAGIQPRQPPAADQRAEVAEHELARVRTTTGTTNAAASVSRGVPRQDASVVVSPPEVAAVGPARADDQFAQVLADTRWHGGPDDLARNAAGIGVIYEATRRRNTEGAGADRSWRKGADGEATVGEILQQLTVPSRIDRLLHRPPAWRVLHSVPVGTGRGDIDHVLIGPPGVVTINTKHHLAAKIRVRGDQLQVNRHQTDYIPKARLEADRAKALLATALPVVGRPQLAERVYVRSVIAVVGAPVIVEAYAPGVAVLMTRELAAHLASLPTVLGSAEVEIVYGIARHRAVWTRNPS